LVNEAAPAEYTRQTLTTTDTVGCKNYLTVTVASAISTFATWNAVTNKLTYTKVPTANADTVFGKHNINFAWKTTHDIAISNKDKAYVMLKPACNPPTFTLTAT